MKIYPILLFILLLSCSVKEEPETGNSTPKSDPEKEIITKQNDSLLIENPSDYLVLLQVYYTSAYCGGAPPNEEILAELNKKRWYQNSPLRIQNTESKKEFKVFTNAEGIAEIELPIGRYSVLIDPEPDEQMNHLFNPKCKVITEKIWSQFSVDENTLNPEKPFSFKVILDFPCDPCDPSMKMRP